ncbi:MAG: phosphomethylpyrimidine synthase [Candidatus Aquicultor secundus]|uniref:Phosphomethylpyrimidine synthase n=1 Tax=Candidatus Aquicultor secundus TaxID=1973895 RepID=A0A2M7T4S6_9ACTN|nr:phosphomethylpyrimidine synthase ThiC [Candidatus Aquicultor secundus]NCO65928.1 phosphomethylpyrimidine synthase ThiC [Solirubrobacter sp.]OIO87400.1 MAG: phosphomethylpyrimidine synthase [Candidatus Aquicultor secundus]PIU27221.1 MAG: phosphomethylpyrimidine synthase [Candidatus Aquicultor secundus]PIW21150.1 MAG: phosphomethylpyrimidine synthase [Candidatus Aquicultor secundus]PIX52016.1 MAG: phosphomethylpyrimidine synthase [Candidatus Aquicultor secundus]
MSTIIERLKKGQSVAEIDAVAIEENLSSDEIVAGILDGTIVIPKNVNRHNLRAMGVGKGLRTKVNANIGTSDEYPLVEEELHKLEIAEKAGADAVMDLSTGGPLVDIRTQILAKSVLPLGTVPIYQAAVLAKDSYGSIVDMTPDDVFRVIETQAKEGVDFMTVHAGITWKTLNALQQQGRVADIVSRGGAFTVGWMIHNDKENLLYEQYDRLLEIARKYDVTLSLGDGLRPGCLADASDRAQFQELLVLGELVDRARKADVQVMVEGPGHMPFDQIAANMRLEKEICNGAPFYVLGPLVTDVAPGYDHITAAIGGTMAAVSGADFLCYVTPREHLGLPTAQDVHDGVIASRIAAHAADIVKGIKGAAEWDLSMAKARKALDWNEQIRLSIDPAKAEAARNERKIKDVEGCTMCGDFCAMKVVAQYLGTKVESC